MLKLMHLLILQDVPLPIGFWIPGAHTICAQTMSGLTHEKEDGGELTSICPLMLTIVRGMAQCVESKAPGEVQPNYLYRLCGTTITGGAAVSTSKDSDDETQLWHLRLGHMSERGMQELHNRKLLKGVQSCKLEFCRFCTIGKQSKIAFKQRNKEEESTGVLDYIHTDVWGPSPVKSKGGARYFVTFLDDFSRKVCVYFMNEKSEVFTKFKEWKAEVENLTGRKIKILKRENGGEYKDNKFLEFCRSEGIKRIHTGLPKSFWAESVNHVAYLVNRSPSRNLEFKCAEEKILSRDVVFDEKTMPMNKVKNSEAKEDVVEKETTIEV
ncbi:unnamed protein product, partial [Prunus brigantina]